MRSDLKDVLDQIGRALSRGVHDRRAPFRTATLATQGPDGPCARMVVVREASLSAACLAVHSDLRAQKIHQIQRAPAVALVFWDPRHQVQLRAQGHAHRVTDAARLKAHWRRLSGRGQAVYSSATAPGTQRAAAGSRASDAPQLTESEASGAEAHFALVEIALVGLDWLSLSRVGSQTGHRRAAFARQKGGWVGGWVEP